MVLKTGTETRWLCETRCPRRGHRVNVKVTWCSNCDVIITCLAQRICIPEYKARTLYRTKVVDNVSLLIDLQTDRKTDRRKIIRQKAKKNTWANLWVLYAYYERGERDFFEEWQQSRVFSMVRPWVKWAIYYCCLITSNSTGCLNMIWLAQELAARPRDFRKWPRVIKIPDKVLFQLCQSGCIVQSTSVASTICFNKNSHW